VVHSVEYKPDFAEAAKRIQAFWQREPTERCALQVVAMRDDTPRPPEDVTDILTKKTDPDYVLGQAEWTFRSHHYLAEAVPVYVPGFVCTDTAAYLGAGVTLAEDTVWYEPVIDDWQFYRLQFDPENRWWQMTRRMAQAATERGRGRYLVGIPDFQVPLDIVSLLRSPERLCLDLIENPGPVKAATRLILDEVYSHCYNDIYSIITRYTPFIGDWMGLFATGRHDVVQCDFAALISPRHFEEFCLPDIQKQCQMLETCIFHLDGPGALRHLDALLEIEELDAIQWVPGDGNPPARAWLTVLKKVQCAGKGLWVSAPPEDVHAILEELWPEGLMIHVEDTFPSLNEAEDFISAVQAACYDRWQR
jgi:hypothetical protein